MQLFQISSFEVVPLSAGLDQLVGSQDSDLIPAGEFSSASELGTRQFISFATTTTRQRNRASVAQKIRKNLRCWCLNGAATTKIQCNAMMNKQQFYDLKHSHVVVAVLSRAQLCSTLKQGVMPRYENVPGWTNCLGQKNVVRLS